MSVLESAQTGASPATRPAAETPPARDTGPAGHAARHWWHERLSSVACLLLWVWLLVSLVRLPALDHRGVTEWLRQPSAAVPMLLLVAATFWHLRMGLKVIVEDYVHDEGNKFLALLLIDLAAALGAAFALFALLKIAFAPLASA